MKPTKREARYIVLSAVVTVMMVAGIMAVLYLLLY